MFVCMGSVCVGFLFCTLFYYLSPPTRASSHPRRPVHIWLGEKKSFTVFALFLELVSFWFSKSNWDFLMLTILLVSLWAGKKLSICAKHRNRIEVVGSSWCLALSTKKRSPRLRNVSMKSTRSRKPSGW